VQEQPDLPFPTNFFLNFWQLMAYNVAYETKEREAIMNDFESPEDEKLPGMYVAFEECQRKEHEKLLKNQFATQNQKAEGEIGMYNADTPSDERPNKRRLLSIPFASSTIDMDGVD